MAKRFIEASAVGTSLNALSASPLDIRSPVFGLTTFIHATRVMNFISEPISGGGCATGGVS